MGRTLSFVTLDSGTLTAGSLPCCLHSFDPAMAYMNHRMDDTSQSSLFDFLWSTAKWRIVFQKPGKLAMYLLSTYLNWSPAVKFLHALLFQIGTSEVLSSPSAHFESCHCC